MLALAKRRVLHAAQLALGYYYDLRRQNADLWRKQAVVIAMEGYRRQNVPISRFSLCTVLAINHVRCGDLTIKTEDANEALLCEDFDKYLNTANGDADLKEALLLGHFIDAQDIDMEMVAQVHDASGVVIFDFDRFTALDEAYACLRKIHRRSPEAGPPPRVKAAALRPRVYSVAPEAAADLSRLFDPKAADTAILQAKLAALGSKTR